jgi:hypothetical protein
MDRVFMKVFHHQIEDYLLLGWIMRPAFTGCHHGHYVVLMEWVCDCPPPFPLKKGYNPS